ncbi:MAG: NnrU family protein [Aestuariivirgaceae bacterium]|jgi:uncharacterized membrane protein
MALLAIAVLVFALVQILPLVPDVADRLAGQLGAGAGSVQGAASVASLILLIGAWRASPAVPLYDPPLWSRIAGFISVLLAFICLGIYLFRGRLRQLVRWPWPLAIVLLALGHLLTLGDLAGVVLFGGLLLYGMALILLSWQRDARPSPGWHAGHDLLSVLAGVALYGVTTQLHGILAGVPVVTLSP